MKSEKLFASWILNEVLVVLLGLAERSVEVENFLGRRNLVYTRFYLVTPKLDDTNAFTLYNCEDAAAALPFVLHT